jgi:hypothetical protein
MPAVHNHHPFAYACSPCDRLYAPANIPSRDDAYRPRAWRSGHGGDRAREHLDYQVRRAAATARIELGPLVQYNDIRLHDRTDIIVGLIAFRQAHIEGCDVHFAG